MKYILVVWYLATAPAEPADTPSPYEEMPGVSGAGVESFDYQKVLVILGRFSDKPSCEAIAEARATNYMNKIDSLILTSDYEYGCFRDPKQ